MKKLLILTSLFLFTLSSCVKDEILLPIDSGISEKLKIQDVQGLKLESFIVSEEVKMNVKLLTSGTYRIKIRDFGGELISQEKINANEGDNILKVYVSSLSNDSYTIELTTDNGDIIGKSTFVVQN